MATFSMTYDIVTPESAEHGGVAESGFHIETIKLGSKGREHNEMSLSTAIRLARNEYCNVDNGNGSFYSNGGDMNYRTGSETSYAVHFDGLTPSTLKRVARLLKAKR